MTSPEQIIRCYFSEGLGKCPYVSMVTPKGALNIDYDRYDKFMEDYCLLISEESRVEIGIGECAEHYLPVLLDLDIKVKKDEVDVKEGDHLYNYEQVTQVIGFFHEAFQKYVLNYTDDLGTCILLEKAPYETGIYLKSGLHLHFPKLFISAPDQGMHIFPFVKEKIKESRMFEELFEDSGQVVDAHHLTGVWLMYGSVKDFGMDPYLISKVFNHKLEEVELESVLDTLKAFDKDHCELPLIHDKEFYLPRFLSIKPMGNELYNCRNDIISTLRPVKREKRQQIDNNETEGEQLLKAKDLLPLLNLSRVVDRNKWIEVGWLLFNISKGSDEGFQLWNSFSKRSNEHYNEDACVYEWDNMEVRTMGIGTLHHWVKLDNPEGYKTYKGNMIGRKLEKNPLATHYDIAIALHGEFSNEFVCASLDNKTWYQFTNHIWTEVEKGFTLRQKIPEIVVQKYKDWRKKVTIQISENEDNKPLVDHLNSIKSQINKMIDKLGSAPFKNNIMSECMELFYKPEFKDELDTNGEIIAFKNGVYDFPAHKFRHGTPDDMLSKAMPVNYNEYTLDDPRVKEIIIFWEKIFPDKSIRDYFLSYASSVFIGGNSKKEGMFWTGGGDNGKSITHLLFEKMLGKYAIKFNTTLLTAKKAGAGAANADLARSGGGVRWATAEEPDGNEEIYVGRFKNYTGNDSFFARDLFEKGKNLKEIQPMFKFNFICNKLPQLRNPDKATWNRVRVIPFESTFCSKKDAPETYEEQMEKRLFPKDPTFGNRIPEMVEPLAWYLIKLHDGKRDSSHKDDSVPIRVREATLEYMKDNDVCGQFIDECIERDNNSILSLAEVYTNFKDWFKEGFPNCSIPLRNDIKTYLLTAWGQSMKGVMWKGYKICDFQSESPSAVLDTGVPF